MFRGRVDCSCPVPNNEAEFREYKPPEGTTGSQETAAWLRTEGCSLFAWLKGISRKGKHAHEPSEGETESRATKGQYFRAQR